MASITNPRPKRRTSKPLPGVVDGEEWAVKESLFGTGQIDRKNRLMSVPLGITPEDRQTKNHEMLHQKFSPKTQPKLNNVDPLVYQACEDYRITQKGRDVGVDASSVPTLNDRDITQWKTAVRGNPLLASTALMSAVNEEDYNALERAFFNGPDAPFSLDDGDYDRVIRPVRNARVMMLHGIYNYDTGRYRGRLTKQSAINAAEYLTTLNAPPGPAGGSSSSSEDLDSDSERAVKDGVREMLDRSWDPSEVLEVMRKLGEGDKEGNGKPSLGNGRANWGTMTVKHKPLNRRLPNRMRSRSWRPTDSGAIFRYPHRYVADKSVFAVKAVKEGGCTLLIDCSGSMSLSQGQILKIMELMPAATIATYNGRSDTGVLAIVGRKGRIASDPRPGGGGGNTIDGPALDWLASQPGPRFWVSDGEVTGIDDKQTPLHFAEAIRIVQYANIQRYNSMDDIIARFDITKAVR